MKALFKRRKNRSASGSVFAELLMILPVFILFVGGIFEISRVAYLQNTLEYGVKEAARIGSSIKESVDSNFQSVGTISRGELENLIENSVRIMGVIEEPEQFMIRYFNNAGTEVPPQDNLPFDRQNDSGAVDYVEVALSYPGTGPTVNTPVPALFNPANIFQSTIMLSSKAVFKLEGRFDR